jgi:RNase P/RNase MRP subunit p29
MKLLQYKLAAGFVCLLLSAVLTAQVKTETSTNKGAAQVQTTVERGEVVAVSGNDLVVKMEDGTLRNFMGVPESARVTVEGKQLSIHDLKPGMKLERTITTTTTPQVVTTVHTVKGKVVQVQPPHRVTLRLEDGSVQQFKIPDGQKFNVNGQETDAFGLHNGMEISATKVVSEPQNVISRQKSVTGQMPQAADIQGPVLIVVQKQPAQVAQATAQSEPPAEQAKEPAAETAQKLPQTASELPLIWLIGTLMFMSGVAIYVVGARKRA